MIDLSSQAVKSAGTTPPRCSILLCPPLSEFSLSPGLIPSNPPQKGRLRNLEINKVPSPSFGYAQPLTNCGLNQLRIERSRNPIQRDVILPHVPYRLIGAVPTWFRRVRADWFD